MVNIPKASSGHKTITSLAAAQTFQLLSYFRTFIGESFTYPLIAGRNKAGIIPFKGFFRFSNRARKVFCGGSIGHENPLFENRWRDYKLKMCHQPTVDLLS
jgi:hypothetical protein